MATTTSSVAALPARSPTELTAVCTTDAPPTTADSMHEVARPKSLWAWYSTGMPGTQERSVRTMWATVQGRPKPKVSAMVTRSTPASYTALL